MMVAKVLLLACAVMVCLAKPAVRPAPDTRIRVERQQEATWADVQALQQYGYYVYQQTQQCYNQLQYYQCVDIYGYWYCNFGWQYYDDKKRDASQDAPSASKTNGRTRRGYGMTAQQAYDELLPQVLWYMQQLENCQQQLAFYLPQTTPPPFDQTSTSVPSTTTPPPADITTAGGNSQTTPANTATTPAPADVTTAAPADVTTAAPAQPTTAAPVQPTTTAPVQPTTAAPVQPTTAGPAQSTTAAPVQPTTAAPVQPTTAAPVQPTTAGPAQSTTAAPVQPTTAAPVQPTTAAPVQPTTAAPVQPTTAAPTSDAATTTP